jgi:hypothetical protein
MQPDCRFCGVDLNNNENHICKYESRLCETHKKKNYNLSDKMFTFSDINADNQ